MAIEKTPKKKPGFSLDSMDNFQTQEPASKVSRIDEKHNEIQTATTQQKKRGRKPGTKLAKSYKFQLVPSAKETQILLTIPVELHEKIKEYSSIYEETVKEFLSKKIADSVGFDYREKDKIFNEAEAISVIAVRPWMWKYIPEEYKTIPVLHTLINYHPKDFIECENLSPELIASITKEQWVKLTQADYNTIKQVPQEYLNYVLKSIKELLNEQGNGEDNSNQ